MKKLDTSNISGLAKAPIIKATHDHIKESIIETTNSLALGIIEGLLDSYNTNDLIILHGCEITANIPGTSSITAGAVYYNGEVYQVDANASLVTSGGQNLFWTIDSSYIASDSSFYWSDGVQRNFHQVEKFQLTPANSGSIAWNQPSVKRLASDWSTSTSTSGVTYSGGTVTSVKFAWIKQGSKVTFSYLFIGAATASASNTSVTIPLPVNNTFASGYGKSVCYCEATSPGALLGSVDLNSTTITATIHGSVINGNTVTVQGQIIYQCDF